MNELLEKMKKIQVENAELLLKQEKDQAKYENPETMCMVAAAVSAAGHAFAALEHQEYFPEGIMLETERDTAEPELAPNA
ncbi:MAG: hypothetical protein PHY64_00360 [Eubacteriales bacterium]|nr:hypothetical protein [Eubacteriales bacterium]